MNNNIFRKALLLFFSLFISFLMNAQDSNSPDDIDRVSEELEIVASEQQEKLSEKNEIDQKIESDISNKIQSNSFFIEGKLLFHSFSSVDNTRKEFVWLANTTEGDLVDKKVNSATGFGFSFGYNFNEQLSFGADYQFLLAGNNKNEVLVEYPDSYIKENVVFERKINIMNLLVFAKYNHYLTNTSFLFGKVSFGSSTYDMSILWEIGSSFKIDTKKQSKGNLLILSGGYSIIRDKIIIPIELAFVSSSGFKKIDWSDSSDNSWSGIDYRGNEFSGTPKLDGISLSLGITYNF